MRSFFKSLFNATPVVTSKQGYNPLFNAAANTQDNTSPPQNIVKYFIGTTGTIFIEVDGMLFETKQSTSRTGLREVNFDAIIDKVQDDLMGKM